MANEFQYDVFLSHSSKDKAVVRDIAKRLQADGLSVWLDEQQIKPGDSIPAKVETGLEYSRVLVLCMSANAFGSDWAQLESGTFRFRDPLNKERRFIPLRLDDAPIKGSLAQFLYIDWRPAGREQAYSKLVKSCRAANLVEKQTELKKFAEKTIKLNDASSGVAAFAFNNKAGKVLSASHSGYLQLSDLEDGRRTIGFETQEFGINCLALSSDRRRALTGSDRNHVVRLWNLNMERCLREFQGHTSDVWSVSWSPDQKCVLSGSADETLRLWDVKSSGCICVFEGHASTIFATAWSQDQQRIVSGSGDNTIRIWDVKTGKCVRIFEGHTELIYGCAFRAFP
jgi:WD40 repeat protein